MKNKECLGGEGKLNALFKIAAKQYFGRFMILGGGDEGELEGRTLY